MDIFESFTQTLSVWTGAHPLITIVVPLLAGVLVGKAIFGKKKDKKD